MCCEDDPMNHITVTRLLACLPRNTSVDVVLVLVSQSLLMPFFTFLPPMPGDHVESLDFIPSSKLPASTPWDAFAHRSDCTQAFLYRSLLLENGGTKRRCINKHIIPPLTPGEQPASCISEMHIVFIFRLCGPVILDTIDVLDQCDDTWNLGI